MAVQASEITLVPAVKLQIGDRDNSGHYWDGGAGATTTGGRRIMTGAITIGVRMTSIAIVMTDTTIITTTTVRVRTGSTINAKPRQMAGLVLLLVALKYQLTFP